MRIALLFLLFIPGLAFGQEPEPALQRIKVRLVDFTPKKICAPCGWAPAASTLKFLLIEDSEDLKKGNNILVIVGCAADKAETYLEKTGTVLFKNGQEYLLVIYKPSTEPNWVKEARGWVDLPYYKNLKLPRYSCKSIDKLR